MASGAGLAKTGAKLATSLLTNFGAGFLGSMAEQKISKRRVNPREAIREGLISSIGDTLFGNSPLKGIGNAMIRGARSGAAVAAINNIFDSFTPTEQERIHDFMRNLPPGTTLVLELPEMRDDPRDACDGKNPFHDGVGYGLSNGNGSNGGRKGFSLVDFLKDVAAGAIIGGLSGATYYGGGKAVEAVKKSINRSVEDGLTIMSRNSGRGNPGAMTHFGMELNTRQKNLLRQLPNYDSSAIINKGDVNLKDLAALTAKTGNEFAMFTRGSQRLVIRGNVRTVNINGDLAKELYHAGYKWSGHTHPGGGRNVLLASSGDRYILKQFNQNRSVILGEQGKFNIFEIGD